MFGQNYGARFADICDGTSNTIMLSELLGGHEGTIRGDYTYSERPVFMADYCPNDPMADLVDCCDAQDVPPAGSLHTANCRESAAR